MEKGNLTANVLLELRCVRQICSHVNGMTPGMAMTLRLAPLRGLLV